MVTHSVEEYRWVETHLRTLGADFGRWQVGPEGTDLLGCSVKGTDGPRWLVVAQDGRDLNTALDKEAIVTAFYRRHQREPSLDADRATFEWPWWTCVPADEPVET